MPHIRLTALLLLGGLSIGSLAGCAGEHVTQAGSEPHESFLCGGTPVSAEAVSERMPLSELTGASQEALSGAKFDDGSPLNLEDATDWFVVEESNQSLTILRDIEEANSAVAHTIHADHDKITIAWVDAVNIEPGWLVAATGSCALTLDLGDLSVPWITLDPENPIDPASRELHLLVTEQSCSSGVDAAGRIKIVRIEENHDRVDLVIGVAPRSGGQDCPSSPATPFTLPLHEPIADRLIVNGSLRSERPLNGG